MSIKDRFRSEWSGVAEAWERWGPAVRAQSAAATTWIAELADIREGMAVLDLASGVGDPAVALARRVGPGGRVVATDLVPGALEFVDRAARAEGLVQLGTQPADMEALPFAAGSFDAVTCRLGLMFAPHPDRALAEVRRVLRPGGKAAFVVWGDPGQPLFAATLGEIACARASAGRDDGEQEEPAPDAPGPFRFAEPARLAAELAAAGFASVRADSRVVPWPFAGSAAEMWRMFFEMGGPGLEREIAALGDAARRAMVDRIVAALERHGGGVGHDRFVDPTACLVGAAGAA